jgi:tRNA-binding protein
MKNIPTETISWNDFAKIEMRIGTIISAEIFTEAKNPSYKMVIDFGEYGTRKSSAQITKLYQTEELIGKQVIAVINFPPKQIANIMSECLVLGGIGNNNEVALIQPDRTLPNGIRIG